MTHALTQRGACCTLVRTAAALLLFASSAQAAVFNITPGPADGAAGSLRAAILAANANGEDDTINLAAGTYALDIGNLFGTQNNTSQLGDLDITEVGFSVTIQGAGAGVTIIDQLRTDRVIQVLPGATLNLNDVTITGGTAVDNGASGAASGSGGRGGGILNSGTLSLSGSVVQLNSAQGGASNEGGGGIYQESGSTTLTGGTQILDNLATGNAGSGGGIFISTGTLTVQSNTIIDRNIANRAGGGIEIVAGTASISGGGTVIRTNQALGVGGVPGTGGNGGGLHITGAASVTFNNCIVAGNTAANEGGGLWNSATGTLNVISTLVDGNTAQGSGGGGIFNNGGSLDIDSGAGPTTVNGNITTGANGAGDGGGILSRGGPVTIDGLAGQLSTVSSNTAAGWGGAIAMTGAGSTLDVSLTNIGNNQGGLRGGGIYFEDGSVNLVSTNVFDNRASFGGGVYQSSGTFTLATSAQITSNDATAGGGGGFYLDANTTTNIFGAVTDNTSTSSGGGFLHDGRTLTIDGGTVSGNQAAISGGAIHQVNNLRDAFILNGSLIDGNTAGAQGGGISIDDRGGMLTVRDSTISNNVADSNNDGDGNGGGINNSGAGTVTVSNSTISGNTAVDGGGIYNGDLGGSSGTLSLTTVDVSNNTAERSGGGLYQRPSAGTLSLAEVSFDGNAANGSSATQGGGGIYNDGFPMTLGGSVAVTNNTATVGSGSGGGIFNSTGGVLTLNGTSFVGNDASRAGGAIEDNSGAGLGVTLTNVSLQANSATGNPGNGGGLHVTGPGDVNITGGNITANTAASEGGGLWNGSGTMTIDSATINDNQAIGNAADNGGGGIFNAGGILNVTNSSINNNVASGTSGSGGGVFNDVGGTINLVSSNIVSNQARRAGGGIEDNSGAGFNVLLTNVLLLSNTASANPGNGGGLHITGAGDAIVTGGSVQQNTAASEGGGLWNGSGTMTIDGVSILVNIAQGAAADDGGGGVFNNGGALIVQGATTINGNVASGAAGNGGGIHVNGGSLTATGTTMNLNSRQGIFAGNGGAVVLTNVTSNAVDVGLEGNGAGSISLSDSSFRGILTRNTVSIITNGTITSTATVDLETTGNIGVQTGGLAGAFDLLLRPAGVASFAAGTNSTYSGVTTLFTGSTVVDGAISGAGGQFTVNAPALLGGSGQIERNLIVGGTLAPGPIAAAPGDTGILTIVGDAGFSAGSQFNIGINALGAGTGHDQLAVAGMVGMALGVPGVNLTGGATTTFNDGDTFVIINNDVADPISGNFANAVPPSPPASIVLGAEQFDFDYLGGDGNDFVLGPTLFTDLAITKTDGVTTAIPGASVIYTITASNLGMTAVSGNTLTDNFPAACTTVTWTCVGVGGGTCTAAGMGNISDTVDLPAGASVTYTATCDIDSAATGTLDNTATVAIGPGVMDIDPANNTAGDSDTLVPTADISVTKTDGLTDAIPGLQTTYTIVAGNAGPSDDPNVTLNDAFPATLNCTYTSVAAGGASGNTAAGSGDLVETLAMPAGSSVTYTAVCDIDPAATGTLVNTASIVGSVTDPNGANNSATDTDNLTPQGDFDISKDDGVTTAVPGQSVTYAIVVTNLTGPSDMMGTVSDSFPAACATVSWTCVGAGGATCTAMGSGNILDAITVPVGGMVSYSATCNIDPAATGDLVNLASVTPAAGYTDLEPDNDNAVDTDTLTPQADLVVTKDDGVTSATPGGSVTWAIGVSNPGPSDAPNSSVTDTFPAFCTTVNWTCVGSGGGTCPANGSGNIAATVNLPAGGSVVFSATCAIDMAATGTLDNTATAAVGPGVTELDPANNSATDSDTLVPDSDLSITKTDGVTSAIPGQSVTYTIVASNGGPSDAVGAAVSDSFPAACTSVSWTCVGAGGGSCAANGSGNIADTINLPAGGTATYSAICTIDPAATGTLDNTATITGAAGTTDPVLANNSATDSDTLTPQADLSITKVDQGVPVPTLLGSSFSYLLTASNAGPSTATSVVVTDSLPSTLTYVSNSCGASFTAPTLTWNIGALGPGTNASCTINVTVATLGSIVNTASISSATADPTPGNNAATNTLVGAQAVDVAISLTADAGAGLAVGDSYAYTVTGTNLGVGLAGGLDFTLTLSGKVSFVSSTCGAELSGNTLSWSVATLADGASTSCDITVVVVLAGDIQATANVATATFDPNLANNTAELAVAVAAIPIPALDRYGLLLLMLLSAGLGMTMIGRVRGD